MITFIVCLVLLVVSYFTYGRYIEVLLKVDKNVQTPANTMYDGVDYIPMKPWRTFLIQLLNIAGLGPIFGAILGAAYGPVAFLWITLGGIFMGAVQDYAAGMISIKHKGLSFPEIIGLYLGTGTRQALRFLTLFLMILVGSVFMVGPAGLLTSLTGIETYIWLIIILVYYFLATILPIDKIIGKVYPIFGAALIFMALSVLYIIFSKNLDIPNITLDNFHNFKSNAEQFPIIPTLFVTIACGAISGFHATQSPLMSRCLTNESQGRPVFFGAMIAESIIALIWAGAAMAFFGGVEALNDTIIANKGNAAEIVKTITSTELGIFGSILAILGVVAAPITSGDTAFRTSRLIIADIFAFDQKKIFNRLKISVPVFIIGFTISQIQFDVIWRYFAWVNQLLAAFALWAIFAYLRKNNSNHIVALIPAVLMTFIVTLYILVAKEGFRVDYNISLLIATAVTIFVTLSVWRRRL